MTNSDEFTPKLFFCKFLTVFIKRGKKNDNFSGYNG